MVQATEDGHWNDPPDPVGRSIDWGVFVQRQVSPELIVIGGVGCDDAAEMSLLAGRESVLDVPPVIGTGIGRVDARAFDGVDRL